MIVWIGLGGNLGEVRSTLRAALRELDHGACRLQAVSSLWKTRPFGPLDQPDFLNAVARVATALAPGDLLDVVKVVERRLGRWPRERWRERELDLDLLLALEDGPVLAAGPRLTLPHAGLCERGFVLAPLLELDPGARDPRDGHELQADWTRLQAQEPDAVRHMEDPGWCRS